MEQNMAEKNKQINDLITRIAMSNPNITSSQVAKARKLYNGDFRPLEDIEAELLAYSAEISVNAAAQMPPEKEEKQNVANPNESTEKENSVATEDEKYGEVLNVDEETTKESYEPNLEDNAPDAITDDQDSQTKQTLSVMGKDEPIGYYNDTAKRPVKPDERDLELRSMFIDYEATNGEVVAVVNNKDNPDNKKLIKKGTDHSYSQNNINNQGYSSSMILIMISMFLSIMTIIISFFAIIGK